MDLRAAWAAGIGQPLSEELVEARRGVDAAGRRSARRAVRRAEAVDDPAIARLAVAEARARQRALGGPTIAIVSGIAVVLIGIAIARGASGHADAALWAALGAYCVYATVAGLRAVARAPKAELLNLERLRDLGQPYAAGAASAQPTRPPLRVQAFGIAMVFAVYDIGYGLAARLLGDKSVTVATVVRSGVLFALVATGFAFVLGPGAARKRASRPTAGTADRTSG
jgi:NADH:ubiquinone oxidoreductase subunit 3 (subunit A)